MLRSLLTISGLLLPTENYQVQSTQVPRIGKTPTQSTWDRNSTDLESGEQDGWVSGKFMEKVEERPYFLEKMVPAKWSKEKSKLTELLVAKANAQITDGSLDLIFSGM